MTEPAVPTLGFSLPSPPDGYEAQKVWFAQYGAQIREIETTLWHLKRRMREEYTASGPIGTGYGTISLEPKGWEWDWLKVLAVNPLLIKDATLTAKGPASLIQRAMSLLEEDCPAAELVMTG